MDAINMKETHIRVDMDYASNPLWFSTDGKEFINGELDDVHISKKLKRALLVYKSLWLSINNIHFENKDKHSSLIIVDDCLKSLTLELAQSLKSELPFHSIYIWDDEKLENKLI
jgi:hypothetical protein